MANVKKLFTPKIATGATVYAIIRREADGYYLNDADGAFANAPADPYLSLTEDATIAGYYEVSESRTAWEMGRYKVFIYNQVGGTPAPATDAPIADFMDFDIIGDRLITLFPFEGAKVETDAGNSATAFMTSLPSATNSYCVGSFLKFASGNLVEQQRKVINYDGATGVVTVASAFTETPAAGDEFFLVNQ